MCWVGVALSLSQQLLQGTAILAKLYKIVNSGSLTMITVTSVEAQNRFGQLLDTVQREPVTITRHGRTAAFIVSPQDMMELQQLRSKRTSAADAFDAYFAKADNSLTPAAGKLTDVQTSKLVKTSR